MKKAISILLLIAVVLTCTLAFVACNKEPEIADNTKYYDTVTKKAKLTKSFEGKSFMNDGIGVATVDAYTDGDTTRFRAWNKKGNDTVIIRYYCIDTPESTGGVEKWGKAASLFVKDRLSQATQIVLESSTGTRPTHDSYGTRYLGYVWYKTANSNDFKLLNLELIENGFTENKALNTDAYPYYSYMDEANKFAKSIKLRIYSELEDPLYSTDPVEMTIKNFWDNTEQYYNADADAGSKIVMTAYLQSLKVSESGTYTFVAGQYDPETNKVYTINVYAAYSSSPATRMKIGQLYKIIGSVQKYGGTFQISGLVYNSLYGESIGNSNPGYEGCRLVQANYYLTFDSTVEYIAQYSKTLYTDVTVKSSSIENGVLTILGSTQKRTEDGAEDAVEFTYQVKVSDSYINQFAVGKKFSVRGYQLVDKSGTIVIPNISDITVK